MSRDIARASDGRPDGQSLEGKRNFDRNISITELEQGACPAPTLGKTFLNVSFKVYPCTSESGHPTQRQNPPELTKIDVPNPGRMKIESPRLCVRVCR